MQNIQDMALGQDYDATQDSVIPIRDRVALLTNTVPPAERSFYLAVQMRFSDFRLFLSSPLIAKNLSSGHWADWAGLNVTVQKSWNLWRTSRHPIGFSTVLHWCIPWDTLIQLRRYQPNLVISTELGPRTLFASLYRMLHPASRLIIWAPCSEHTERARGRLRTWIRRILLRFADAVLVNGASGRRYMESMGVAPAAIFFVPRAVDLDPFAQIPLKRRLECARRLLYVGQLIERKGVHLFLQALNRWARLHREHRIEFWLQGDGPMRSELEALPMASSVYVRFLGSAPNTEIPKIYGQAGILAFPTLADEWGLPVNEAMAAGLPVLGSRYSEAVEEMVETDVTGWKFRADHAGETDEAIDRAMRVSDEQLDLMRSAARERAAAFAPEKIADRVVSAARFVMPPAVGKREDGAMVEGN